MRLIRFGCVGAMACGVAVVSAFVLPGAAARAAAGAADFAGGFEWVDRAGEGTADLMYDGKPVLRYMYAFDRSTPQRTTETFKVFHHLFGPGTEDLITNGAGAGLYPHHRGLFVGWRRTRFEGGEIDSCFCKEFNSCPCPKSLQDGPLPDALSPDVWRRGRPWRS